jgi:hypothetical protein
MYTAGWFPEVCVTYDSSSQRGFILLSFVRRSARGAAFGTSRVLVDISAPGGPAGRHEALYRFMSEVVPQV